MSIVKKNLKNDDKIALLAKTKLNSIDILICKASDISYSEIAPVNMCWKNIMTLEKQSKLLKIDKYLDTRKRC